MAVYVDDVRHAFGRMVMCHMWADTLDELLAMADRIGVQRKWIQGHPTLSLPKARGASLVHFDISLGMKVRAIEAGAVLTDKFGPAEHEARRKGNTRMLEMIERSRALRRAEGEAR
jgi:hypothetical protein